jgi:hypothetical protein
MWEWLSFAGTAFLFLFSIGLLLLVSRKVGKPPGQDPKYDTWIQWSGTFKVVGILGIICFALEVLSLFVA